MNEQTKTIKSLGYLSWKDPHAWMESMKGEAWTKAVDDQQHQFQEAIRPLKGLVATIDAELEEREDDKPSVVHGISYTRTGSVTYRWWSEKEPNKGTECGDLDIRPGGAIWYMMDTPTGDEQYALVHWDKKILWKTSHSFGPFVAVLGNWVYVLESEQFLWFCRLVRYDARTGKHREVVYEMKDPEWNLALVKGEHQCLFLLGNNAGKQRLWHVQEKGLEELTGRYESFVPVGYSHKQDTTDPCFFGRSHGTSVYRAVGRGFSGLRLPSLAGKTPEVCSFSDGYLVTRSYGKRTLWNLHTGRVEKVVVGEIVLDSIQAYSIGKAKLTMMLPGQVEYAYGISHPPKPYAQVKYSMGAKSRDGTRIPVVFVSSVKNPGHVLVVGYGAYGVGTHMGTSRWRPLLRRGWAICFVLVRGGGDHDDAWAETARREKKIKSVEDFEAGLRHIRRALDLPAKKITIYGRSAGGYLVGSVLARHTQGDLFGGVYMEVPYVDVLSTTSNPSLPLTQLEYNEFGDPLHRPQDAEALLNLSPVQSISVAGGAPNVYVLCRTALHDKEVYAYESMKWIRALQDAQASKDGAAPKLLAIADHQGHFGKAGRAEDLALLLFWAGDHKKSHEETYTMANTRRNNRKNRKNTRKNRKNRKDTRKNRKNNMMGGKRRRTNASRKNRKH